MVGVRSPFLSRLRGSVLVSSGILSCWLELMFNCPFRDDLHPLQGLRVLLLDCMVSLACFERQGVYRSIALMFLSRDFLESLPKPLHLPGSLASVRGTECSCRPTVPLWSDGADWSLVVETFHWISCLGEPSREGPPLFYHGGRILWLWGSMSSLSIVPSWYSWVLPYTPPFGGFPFCWLGPRILIRSHFSQLSRFGLLFHEDPSVCALRAYDA